MIAARIPLLLGLAATTVPEPVALVLAGLGLMGFSLRMQRLHAAQESAARHRSNLARLTAPAIARLVAEADPAGPCTGWEQEATILFADIRGFTSLCEGLTPGEAAAFLAAFRARAARAVEAEGGVVDKFVGDEVMAVFGLPSPSSDDADRAVAAAHRLAAAMRAWSSERAAAGLQSVRLGIGLHRGPIFLGMIGADRIEFTAVGDTVNVARRLEQMTRTVDCECLASEAVTRAARAARMQVVPIRSVRGRRAGLRMFALSLTE
ncbi:adenylate/guanylate cyclase domain-containing protein [Methylobacterium frigidaeris]|uniref:adenylate/guanylate cyclase domain-containing protein n=1 Tax=Methylobacterium frigidaeris TaxID=2038277 RepID=UPI001EDD9C03|nr:adenylate/guanylate cyclase domain-containing protein [Methylobacterium frigidaeris]